MQRNDWNGYIRLMSSSSPLSVLQIQNALQQKVIPHLDLTDPKVAGASHDESKVLTRALAAVAVWEQAKCTLEEAAASVVDGGHDGGIDAIHVELDPPRLFIVQSKWRAAGNATLSSDAVNKLRDGFEDLTQGNVKQFNRRVRDRLDRIRQVQLDPDCEIIVVIALLGDNPVHPDQHRGLRKIAERHGQDSFEFRYMHLEDFRQIVKQGISAPAVELTASLLESFHRPRDGKRLESYVGTIKARDVFKWVSRYGERLFDDNIRGSLGDTSVNEQIRSTLQNEPETFWDMNKGVIIVANQIKRATADSGAYSSPAHLTLPRASIVDGGQTARSIHKVLADLDGLGRSGEAQVPVKIISLEGTPADLAGRIAVATNTQNAILQRDLVTNDEVQGRLHFELDVIGKRYVYKRSADPTVSSPDTCRIEEVALALMCQQNDASLIGRVRSSSDALWEQGNGSIYQQLFSTVPDARLAWNSVCLFREVEARMERVASGRTGRAVAMAENASWLTCHVLFRLVDNATIKDASDEEWEGQMRRLVSRCDDVLDRIIHHADAVYGADAFPKTTFADARRCKVIASKVLADLRNRAAVPELNSSDRKRERARNAVEYIVDSGRIANDTILTFRPRNRSRRPQMEAYLESHPEAGRARWTNNRKRPLVWETDSQHYAPSPLAGNLVELITGIRPVSLRGPDFWVTPEGATLTELAAEIRRGAADVETAR